MYLTSKKMTEQHTMYELIRLYLNRKSDLDLHCLLGKFCSKC